MKEYIVICPHCKEQFKISINDSGEVSTVIFDEQIQDQEVIEILQEKNIYFGCKGGGKNEQ